jgi:hypothetical protein
MPVSSLSLYANKVTVGDFSLPDTLVHLINVSKVVELTDESKDKLNNQLKKPVELLNNQLYVGKDPHSPELGDVTISLSAVYPQSVSIIAQQTGNTVQAYQAPAGESILLLSSGTVSSTQMISDALSENKMMGWIFRAISLLMLIIGFSLLFRPLVVLADVLTFLGSMVGFSTGFIGLVLGLSVWIIATSIAWFATRPLFIVGVIVIVLILGYLLIKMKGKKG